MSVRDPLAQACPKASFMSLLLPRFLSCEQGSKNTKNKKQVNRRRWRKRERGRESGRWKLQYERVLKTTCKKDEKRSQGVRGPAPLALNPCLLNSPQLGPRGGKQTLSNPEPENATGPKPWGNLQTRIRETRKWNRTGDKNAICPVTPPISHSLCGPRISAPGSTPQASVTLPPFVHAPIKPPLYPPVVPRPVQLPCSVTVTPPISRPSLADAFVLYRVCSLQYLRARLDPATWVF